MRILTGSTTPALQVTVSDPDTAVDLSSADVTLTGRLDGIPELVFDDRPATTVQVVGQTSVVTMEWEDGDTDTPGFLVIELAVTWPDDTVEKIDAGAVNITQSLDYVPA